ncbi:MAG: DUF3810 domain-containing protein [Bacteroidota bacterium]|nr:DUF3810 domain-containing protein [Bacteroidota bacterium]
MIKTLLRNPLFLVLFVIVILIKLFSLNEAWVENYYTYGFYPFISSFLRLLLGWIPFSMGDVLYTIAVIYFVIKVWNLLRSLAKRRAKEYFSQVLFTKYLMLVLCIYIFFNLLWGLNYNRQGIAKELALDVQPYTRDDLYRLTYLLQQRLCIYGDKVDSIKRLSLNRNKNMFKEGVTAYQQAQKKFPFLNYKYPSIKASLYTPLGHLFGFTGYYNPFSAEAQIKTTIPVFLKPFVLCHEIGHLLGYAKENEANFVGFLTSKNSDNIEFRYSAYFNMWLYGNRELSKFDLQQAKLFHLTAHEQVKKDYHSYQRYIYDNKNVVEPFVSLFYDNYLKMNNQPKGARTYNEVTAWLIAYLKKYGPEAI